MSSRTHDNYLQQITVTLTFESNYLYKISQWRETIKRKTKKTSSGECHSIEFYITDHNSDHSHSKWNFGLQKDISITAAHW